MKEFMKKLGAGIKAAWRWLVRVFEEKDGTPSSKRIFGAFLVVAGAVFLMSGGDTVAGGVILGAGLGMFGVSSWSK